MINPQLQVYVALFKFDVVLEGLLIQIINLLLECEELFTDMELSLSLATFLFTLL